jgi:hypothetical protein
MQELQIRQNELAVKLNNSVAKVLTTKQILGFEKANIIAEAIGELKVLLSNEYMKPIMALQGNRLGFKSDKDKEGGYPIETVKNCLIEAVLTGVQPFGNQFNIIAGNCYITKEGFGYLLANYTGLVYSIIPQLPRIKDQSGAVIMDIEWTLNGVKYNKSIDFAIKVNNFMGTDAVIGKATRKARAWLYNTISGCEVADGDANDNDARKTIIISTTESIDPNELHELFELKKDVLSDSEIAACERVLSTGEVASYAKIQNLLKSK